MNITKLEERFMSVLGPIAEKVSNNPTLRAISQGFMKMIPITIGLALFAIIGNLPIPVWTQWLSETGIKESLDAALGASTNALSLYISFSVAYCFAKDAKKNAITSGFLSMASFIILMPQTIEVEGQVVKALSFSYLGADGMLVGLIIALFSAHIYCWLVDKGISFKMPDSVPPNVSESLSPIFVSMIMFAIIVCIRIGFRFTSYGNIFACISQLVSIPLMQVGATVPTVIIILFIANVIWFFGIHPNAIQGPAQPLFMMAILANIEAFQQGKELPYLGALVVMGCASIGGSGSTLGLLCCMFGAKSKRYQSMLKLSFVPNLFNINEPLIFGMPIMLNPVFFIPMTCSTVVMGIIGYIGVELLTFSYNPLMQLLPWTTPFVVRAFLAGGIPLLMIFLVALAANALLYYPFFRIADRQAVLQEQEDEAVKLAEHKEENAYAV